MESKAKRVSMHGEHGVDKLQPLVLICGPRLEFPLDELLRLPTTVERESSSIRQ